MKIGDIVEIISLDSSDLIDHENLKVGMIGEVTSCTNYNEDDDNYTNYVSDLQTTSILNSPYFINAIQKGVFNFWQTLLC